ncbi:MAG: hypothetical protein KKD90_01455 [Candidatus Omnitrophica bacterium]|nr:hypothetical protein [Candidatus Omnitrophota bacterium]MBU4149675.1 hypothetical protein [Candidatus Omnitrophota bacterium]
MNIQDSWEKALKHTKVVRPRAQELQTFSDTELSYIFLAEALVNAGDTIVRKGQVMVEKPAIILPPNLPQFDGFDFEKEFHINQDMVTNFFLIRGVSFPSMKYNNKTDSLKIYDGHVEKAIGYYSDMLERREDVNAGLIVGPEDCWQFSVLIFICTQVARSSNSDIRRIIERFRKDK